MAALQAESGFDVWRSYDEDGGIRDELYQVARDDGGLAAVLQHVQVLEACGLVRSAKLGRTRTCSINPAALRSAESWIADRRTMVERNLDRLGEYLAATADQPDATSHAEGKQ